MAPAKDHESHSRRRRAEDGGRDDDRDDDDYEPRHRGDRRDQRPRPSERERERERNRDRERRRSRDRRRSRTPDSPDRRRRRSRDRERERDSGRDRDRSSERDHQRQRQRQSRGGERERERERDREKDSRRRRHPSDDAQGPQDAAATSRQSPVKRTGPLPSQDDSFAITQTGGEAEKPKEKPNLGNTGLLAAMSNSVTQADGSSITLKYHEPPEARKPAPRDQWKLFVFKGGDIVDTVDLSARSCWLVGREVAVVDLAAEHPSVSKQHAVIQFRYTEKRNEFGDKVGRVKPYLIDLESANGTTLNHGKVPHSRYLELRDKDMVQFGHSAREYVVMLAPRE